jgi:antigen flippase
MSYLKTGVVFAIPTICRLLSGLLIIKVIAINLGADGLGRLGQFMSLLSIVTLLAGGGISAGIVKYVAQFKNEPSQLAEYVQVASFITFASSIVLGIILYVFSGTISSFLVQSTLYVFEIKVLAFIQTAIAFSTFLLGIVNGHRFIKDSAVINMATIIFGSAGVIFGSTYFGASGAMFGLMWYSSCQVIFLLIWYRYWFSFPFSFIKPHWLESVGRKFANFGLMQLVTVLTLQMSQVLMRNIIESKTSWVEVGYWQGLTKVSDAYLQFITIVLANYYMPKLSEARNKAEISSEVHAVYKLVIPILLILIPTIIILRVEIVQILFSKEFLPMSELFVWQMMGDFFKVIAYVAGYVAVAKAATRLYVAAELFQALVLVLLCYFLVQGFGIKGAVYAYFLTYLIYAAIALLGLKIYLGKPLR